MESRHKERMDQIEKSIKALEKADKSGLIGKIAGWVGSAAMVVAGAALIASGVGAVAGGLMLAGAAVMITSQISGETGGWMNEGLADMFEAMGVPKDQTELAASLLITGVVLGFSVGSGVAGAVAPATSTALTAVRVGQAANVASSAASVGEGSAGVATAEYSRQAAFAQANAAEQRAFIQELMLFLQGKNDQLSDLLNEHRQAVGVATETLESTHAAKTQVANNIGA